MGGSFFRLSFFLKNSLRLISSGFYPALRTPSFRHPKDTNINLECQQKKNKSFSCLIRGLFVYLGMGNKELLAIADDTSRTPKERDLARILALSVMMLTSGNYEGASNILNIYVEEKNKIKVGY